MRHKIHFRCLDLPFLEAIPKRLSRKKAGRLLAAEALLRGGRDDVVVRYECGRGIEALRDSVLPLGERRKCAPFECDALVQSAKSNDIHSLIPLALSLLTDVFLETEEWSFEIPVRDHAYRNRRAECQSRKANAIDGPIQ